MGNRIRHEHTFVLKDGRYRCTECPYHDPRRPLDFRVLVTGSRHFDRSMVVDGVLDEVYEGLCGRMPGHHMLTVVHGKRHTGADYFANLWVRARQQSGKQVTADPHPADWAKYGNSAGPRRNSEMVASGALLCLAFFQVDRPCDGTTDCSNKAKAAGIPLFDCNNKDFDSPRKYDRVMDRLWQLMDSVTYK